MKCHILKKGPGPRKGKVTQLNEQVERNITPA